MADASPVKFYYFPLTARGLPSVLALEVSGIPYEGHAVSFDEWPKLKASGICPYDYLVLLVLPDGTRIQETAAVLMTIGKLGGLNGDSTSDFGISAMLSCKTCEMMSDFAKHQPTLSTVKNFGSAELAKLKEYLPKLSADFAYHEKMCTEEGFFTSTGTTVGELWLWGLMYEIKRAEAAVEYGPKLQKFYARLEAHPAVQKVITGKSQMGALGDYIIPVPKDL
mmetsp:Transcript_66934/g.160293  ORF Transcript_66934/g.160293 Transcript_66934/m.160293 type:complete len:223 (+) Transcript_66934:90-758(+)|eukprot:CAMPEP_0178416296 /NCGR_PEP_ID=MMETSP0689_2-20121128/23992_1 /TAXON_ID=160604 /ORGANISM="Amphidinium massartii, Strain CS-259" /LENGTH=222 /DNA_ID=CAMNT_0020037639 /DNA_START=15 /DNA_END=683 /DNA_ORIENTATION=+